MGNHTGDLAAGAIGGLLGGIAVSAVLLAMERRSGTPSAVVQLGRQTAARLHARRRYPAATPGTEEQLLSHGGHLALSAAAGAAYVPMRRATGLSTLPAGLLFGAAFYGLAWGVTGPAIGFTALPWQDSAGTLGQKLMVHTVFGTVTAFVADCLAQR